MPWVQFQVPEDEYERIAQYARAKDRDPGNLALHATRQMMRRYPLRASELAELEKRHQEGPKD